MKKNIYPLIGLLLIATLVLGACSKTAETVEPVAEEVVVEDEVTTEAEPVTVGVFVADSFGDRAFYDIALGGIEAVENDWPMPAP